jgi:uncharacterized protein (TIGR03435 family)
MRVILAGLVAVMLFAQSPTFEAATIKPNKSGENGGGYPGLRNGLYTGRNASMKMMLRSAWDLSESRIFGPDWFDSDRFDVEAKIPPGATQADMMLMFQALLKERFHLELHREMREMPVFDMVVAKGGLKMELSTPEHRFPQPPPNPGGSMNVGAGTMPQIAQRLSGAAGRTVLDKTGLDGVYGFLVIFTPMNATNPPEGAPPDFFTAVEQQLGLKLQPNKEPIEVLVVDHADRTPTDN